VVPIHVMCWAMCGCMSEAAGAVECECSVPVMECSACGDCNYGENDEAHETIAACNGSLIEVPPR
jgi:hypothetical protein